MITITEKEITEYTKSLYINDCYGITVYFNLFNGERKFTYGIIAYLLATLNSPKINDEMVIIHTKNLLSVASEELTEYKLYLDNFAESDRQKERALAGEKLSKSERKILSEMMESNLGEYLFKADYKLCCYSAMKAFLITTLCILKHGIDVPVKTIDMLVDIDDKVQRIDIVESDNEVEHIYVHWNSRNKINNLYILYKTDYVGLEDSSILDLVSADVIEEDYYMPDERFPIAPSILMKQYLSIIEREVNNIIRLSGLNKKEHYDWYDMKNVVRKCGIEIESLPFRLYEALDTLYPFRNDSMHGSADISIEDYEILRGYKNGGLFLGLSAKILELKGITLHPTVNELRKFFE